MLKHFEHVGMTVSDLDRSLGFYVDLLGLNLVLRKPAPSGRGETAFLDAGGAMLEISAPAGPVSTPAREVRSDEAGLRHLSFTFEDIEATHARLVAAGVESVEPPRDAFNTEILSRVAFVRDPDGIVIELVQR
jgi:glyoxylase I family protein